jgi:hypothetical protein
MLGKEVKTMSTNQTNISTLQSNPTLSQADTDAIMTAITTIRQKLPFLTDLTSDERKTLSKLGDKSHGFLQKAVDVATQNPEILPASHPLEVVTDTAQTFQGLSAIKLALQQLYQQVNDTTIKAGSDAFAMARTIYAATKSPIAGAHLASATDSLSKRFVRKARTAAATGTDGPAPSAPPAPTPPKPQA